HVPHDVRRADRLRPRVFVVARSVYNSQNGPTRPTRVKIVRASSFVGRRKSAARRLPYHFCERSHACGSVMTAPRTTLRAAHQRSTSSSDRKSRMFAQVKKMSSQKCAAGTSRCTTASPKARPPRTPHASGTPDHAQRASIVPSFLSAARMPNASHAQGANHDAPSTHERNGVATSENGGAQAMTLVPG